MTWLRAITASIPSEGACLGNTTSYGADPDVFAGLTRRPMSTRSPASNASRSRWRSPPSTSEASTSMSTTSTPGGPPGPGCASVDEPVSRHKIQPPRRIAPPSPSLPGLRSTPSQGLPRRWQASGAFGAARRVRPGPPRATWPCRQAVPLPPRPRPEVVAAQASGRVCMLRPGGDCEPVPRVRNIQQTVVAVSYFLPKSLSENRP